MKRGSEKHVTDVCPTCGATYDGFKTGLTFKDIYGFRWREDTDPSTWMYKRRHTILGFWHELKKELWVGHLAACAEGRDLQMDVYQDDGEIDY